MVLQDDGNRNDDQTVLPQVIFDVGHSQKYDQRINLLSDMTEWLSCASKRKVNIAVLIKIEESSVPGK